MDEREDVNLSVRDFVEKSVSLNEQLSDVGLVEFWNNPAALAKNIERCRGIQCLNQEAFSGGQRILRDVSDSLVEHVSSVLGPNYPARPRSHFRRRARSTSS
jgi:hypothetical protein